MHITILGAGNLGSALGRKWAAAGHPVTFGVRDLNSPKTHSARQSLPAAGFQSISDAISVGEVVLFSTPYAAVAGIASAQAAALADKIVIDATNNLAGPVLNNVHTLLNAVPTAQVFRAFNSLGWEIFANPQVAGVQADHFYCGPDGEARLVVEGLIHQVGVRPLWVGGLETLPTVDAVGALWLTLVFRRGLPRSIALKLLGA